LLFFAHEKGEGSIHHVGIYYGKGKMLHSPKTGKTVELIELKGTLYEEELCAARRYY
jgi:cell wall-associated NlpC family hydrolase